MSLRNGIFLGILVLCCGRNSNNVRADEAGVFTIAGHSAHLLSSFGMPDDNHVEPAPKPESEAEADSAGSIEQLLESITNYRYILLYILLAVTIFGGIGFIIAFLSPETRMYFFSDQAVRNFYILILFFFLAVLLRLLQIVSDSILFFAFAFGMGVGACLLANSIVARQKRDLP